MALNHWEEPVEKHQQLKGPFQIFCIHSDIEVTRRLRICKCCVISFVCVEGGSVKESL